MKKPFTMYRSASKIQKTIAELDNQSAVVILTPSSKPSSLLYKIGYQFEKKFKIIVQVNYEARIKDQLKESIVFDHLTESGLQLLVIKNGQVFRFSEENKESFIVDFIKKYI